ncbi:hypothetical protein ACFZAR_36425 [Streptomyces sp. NPDC008222]|uniref:hypothetical protein n=1 Tax=Streptomyces sp. NPDC008222 TaxID=3364820 RepID=UPI0036EF37E6
MTAEVLRTYRFRCDAAECSAVIVSEAYETPEGWTEVSSTAHHSYTDVSGWKASAKLLRAMTANGIKTTGRFSLHLCPEHPNALDEHLPRTDGISPDRLVVSCSCGTKLGEAMGGAKTRWQQHVRGER